MEMCIDKFSLYFQVCIHLYFIISGKTSVGLHQYEYYFLYFPYNYVHYLITKIFFDCIYSKCKSTIIFLGHFKKFTKQFLE